MRHRSSPLLRAARALVGLVTIWCLGCSGYEPLIDSLLGAGAGSMMECGSAAMADATDASPSVAGGTDHGQSGVSTPTDTQAFDCGCGNSCHAPSPAQSTIAALNPAIPVIEQAEPVEPASVSRVPLLPPPEFTA